MASTEISIRSFVPADIPAADALSVAVGWPHRAEDWAFALAVGEGIVAEIDGRFAGTAMWWPFEGNVARLGMVIVDPVLQRSGIGKRLMREVLDHLTASALLLVATTAGAPLYRKLGFEDSSLIAQHQGLVVSASGARPDLKGAIRPGRPQDVAHLVELDRQATGAARPLVIETISKLGETVVLEDNKRPAAFAIRRRFGRGDTIGPVVARTTEEAKGLIEVLLEDRAGCFVRADVPLHLNLSPWLAERGMAKVSEVLTMIRGDAPSPSAGIKTFALVSQALG